MKIVINRCFGGFSINSKLVEKLGLSSVFDDVDRTNEILINEVESEDYKNDNFASLKVVEIPDETTDYTIIDYDGMESVIYVLDGKLYKKCS